MIRSCFLVMFTAILFNVIGCGGSNPQATTAEHDELSKWVNENPAPEEEVSPDEEP